MAHGARKSGRSVLMIRSDGLEPNEPREVLADLANSGCLKVALFRRSS